LEEEYAECAASNAKKFDDVGRTLGALFAVRLAGFVEGFAVDAFFTVAAFVDAFVVALLVVFAVVVVFLVLMDVAG
jgi:predicted lipid-binding transport protein (Tim44 family)